MFGIRFDCFFIMVWLSLFAVIHPAYSIDSATCAYTDPPSMEFMRNWLMCGSFPIKAATPEANMERKRNNRGVMALDDAVYKVAFDFDYLQEHGGELQIEPREGLTHTFSNEAFTWKYYPNDYVIDSIDLRGLFNPVEDVVVYAYAEINMTEAKKLALFLGSDDSVKVWLNGEMIHEVFTGRPLQIDQDDMELDLKKGNNRLLIKIQNMTLDFGFACRIVQENDYKKLQFRRRNSNTIEYFSNLFTGFFHNNNDK